MLTVVQTLSTCNRFLPQWNISTVSDHALDFTTNVNGVCFIYSGGFRGGAQGARAPPFQTQAYIVYII